MSIKTFALRGLRIFFSRSATARELLCGLCWLDLSGGRRCRRQESDEPPEGQLALIGKQRNIIATPPIEDSKVYPMDDQLGPARLLDEQRNAREYFVKKKV